MPWTVADTDAGIIACMRRWSIQRVNIDAEGELRREIERRRREFADSAAARLVHLAVVKHRLVPASPADQCKMDAPGQFDGYVKNGRVLLESDVWRRLWAGLNLDAVKKYLLQRQLLIPGPQGEVPTAEKVKSGAPAVRVYVLAPGFIDRA